jgi:hypothetical protein
MYRLSGGATVNQESTTRRAETPLEKRVISIINAAINEHNELSVASYGELVHRVVKLVEGQSAPAPQPVQDAGETWELSTGGLTIYRRKQIAYVPIVQSCYAEWQEGSEQWPNKAESREIMQQIVRDHPAAQAVPKLVAALSSIRARVSNGSDFANIIDEALAIAQ